MMRFVRFCASRGMLMLFHVRLSFPSLMEHLGPLKQLRQKIKIFGQTSQGKIWAWLICELHYCDNVAQISE